MLLNKNAKILPLLFFLWSLSAPEDGNHTEDEDVNHTKDEDHTGLQTLHKVVIGIFVLFVCLGLCVILKKYKTFCSGVFATGGYLPFRVLFRRSSNTPEPANEDQLDISAV